MLGGRLGLEARLTLAEPLGRPTDRGEDGGEDSTAMVEIAEGSAGGSSAAAAVGRREVGNSLGRKLSIVVWVDC